MIFLFIFIFYWAFSYIYSDYNIENWVWTRTLAALCCILKGLASSSENMWTSSCDYPQQTRFSADTEILSAIVIEAVTPLTIPQFWPPDSLKYRSKLICRS